MAHLDRYTSRAAGFAIVLVACCVALSTQAAFASPLFHLAFEGDLANTGSGSATATAHYTNPGNVSYVPGLVGHAIDLGNASAAGQSIEVGQALPDVGTISTWYYAKGPWYNYQTVFDNAVNPDDWEMWIYNSGVVKSRINSGHGDVSYDLDNLHGPNNWYHIAYTWDKNDLSGTAANLYVNGQLRSSDDMPSASWVDPAHLFLAGGNGNSYGTGIWDEFKVYDTKLSAAEVAAEYREVPVVHLALDGNLTNTGSGGSDYDGTLVDGSAGAHAYVPARPGGPGGQALDLDNPATGSPPISANGDYVSIDYQLADQGTIALWYNAQDWYNYQTIFDNSAGGDFWEMWIYNNGVARFRVNNDSGVDIDLDDLNGSNEWYHFAVTWQKDGSNVDLQLYVDGELVDTATTPWRDPGTQFFLAGGRNSLGNGVWDDLYIFERVLSKGEIRATAGIPEPGSLVLLALGGLGLIGGRRRWRRR